MTRASGKAAFIVAISFASLLLRNPRGLDEIAPRLFEDLVRPVDLEERCRRGAQQRVAQRERVEDVRVENDLEWRGEHPIRAELLQLGIAPDVFAQLRQRVESRLALLVSLLLEREDVLDAHASMLAGLRVGQLARVEQPNEVLTRDTLRRSAACWVVSSLPVGTTVIESPRARTSATRSRT